MKPLDIKALLVIFAFSLIARAVLTIYLPTASSSPYPELLAQAAGYLILLLLCCHYFKLGSAQIAALVGERPHPRSALALMGWAVMLLFFALGDNAVEAWTLSQFDKAAAYRYWSFHERRIAYPAFVSPRVLAFLVVTVLIGPLVEEFFFRALLLRALAAKHGFTAAAFISSFVFAAMHFSRMYFLSTFVLSLSLCCIYLLLQSLTACVIVHATFNFMAFVHQDYFDIHWTRAMSSMDSLAAWRPELAMLGISLIAMTLVAIASRRRILDLANKFPPPIWNR